MAETVQPRDLPRLAGLIASDASDQRLDVRIGFSKGPENWPVVRIRVSGTVALICQRCLASVSWPLDVDVALTAVGSDDVADELADPFDSIVLDEAGGLAVRAVVEDEILAALPIAPSHRDGEGCRATYRRVATESPRPNRPFADLADLLHGNGTKRED